MPAVQFGAWIPLTALLPPEAGAAAPSIPTGAGVFQLRIEQGLLSYPRGRSAMVAYFDVALEKFAFCVVERYANGNITELRATYDPDGRFHAWMGRVS